MPAGYEVKDANGNRAWWDGKKLTPLDARGYAMKTPPPQGGSLNPELIRRAQDSVAAIDDATRRSNWFRTGFLGGVTQVIPGSPAYNLDKDLDTLKARTAFDGLQAMRAASPTGGALGGIAVDELKMLQAAEANLDVGQSEKQLDTNLGRMRSAVISRLPGVSADNPIDLTEANRHSLPQGSYFRVNGKVYRNTRGAGPAGTRSAANLPRKSTARYLGTE